MKVVIVQKNREDLETIQSALSESVGKCPPFQMEEVTFTQSPENAVRLAELAAANSEPILVVCGLVFDGSISSGERLAQSLKQANPDVFIWGYSFCGYYGDPSNFVVIVRKYEVDRERLAEMIAVFAALGCGSSIESLRKFAPLFL